MLVLLVVVLFPGVALADSSLDQRFLAGLRERRLFELAEEYCLARIAQPELAHDRRVELAVELVRCYAEQALQTPPLERAPLWRKAHRVADDFQGSFPDSPRSILVEVQDALTWLAQGELVRQEAELSVRRAELMDEARDHLRQAIRRFDQLDRRLTVALRQPRQLSGSLAGLSAEELDALQKNLALQSARAYRNQGECYEAESADRANSLTSALEQLDALAELAVADEIVWRSRLERVVCHRLLGDTRRAGEALTALVSEKPPAHIAQQAEAEKVRLLLAGGQVSEALASAKAASGGGQRWPDLDYAELEAHLAALQSASDADDKQQMAFWQRQSAELVRKIEAAHGPYWMRRAETLLARSVGGAGIDLAALARSAESFYRSGQVGDALAAYDRAFSLAESEGNAQAAFDVAFTAASIEHERRQHAEALARYRRLALKFPQHPRAGQAHLLALLNQAQLVRGAEGAEQRALLDTYAELLGEHLSTWRRGSSADQARLWLGNLKRSQRDWPAAVSAYREVAADHDDYETAVAAAAACYEAWLSALKQAGEPREKLATEAAEYLEGVVIGSERKWPEQWSHLHRSSALISARIRLRHTRQGEATAERMLTAALSLSGDAPAAWQAEARTLLVYALAAGGRADRAVELLDESQTVEVAGLLDLLESLVALADEAEGQAVRALSELQTKLVSRIDPRREELRPLEDQRFRQLRAAVLYHAGQREEALAAYEQLARQFPNDGRLHERYAALLSGGGDAAALREALSKWREVESKSRPGTDRWFQARYAQAELHYRLKEADRAARLIQLTQVLQPELGGPELKGKFEKLLALCQGQPQQ